MTKLLLALVLVLVGCGLLPFGSSIPGGDVAAKAGAQRAIWEAAGIHSYTFTVSRRCFCPPEWSGPFEVTIVDDAVVRVTRDGAVVPPAAIGSIPTTIEAVFMVILDNADAPKIEVTYDPTFGFPVEISVDPILNAIDDEFGISVTALTPTP